MFGTLGMQEIILILFILLLLFGAKRLPELGQSLGKGIREFKRGVSEIQEEIDREEPPRRSETPRGETETERNQT
ncbi:MAG: twin-arginine translocase TatA/TatE family subunit [Gemmatimonadota bacterium]|nr:twin-arginine translocase TatA/TatE family subunit [Gemmatimonadota bacterium]